VLTALPLALPVWVSPVDVDCRVGEAELLRDLARGESSPLEPFDLRHPLGAAVAPDRCPIYPHAGGAAGAVSRR
jgi:hypothetical protein